MIASAAGDQTPLELFSTQGQHLSVMNDVSQRMNESAHPLLWRHMHCVLCCCNYPDRQLLWSQSTSRGSVVKE